MSPRGYILMNFRRNYATLGKILEGIVGKKPVGIFVKFCGGALNRFTLQKQVKNPEGPLEEFPEEFLKSFRRNNKKNYRTF